MASPASCQNANALNSVQLLGRCIKDLPREEVFVATKVGKYIPGEDEDFSADRVTKSVHESLKRLQLDYIDLIHCHDIESAKDMKQVRSRLLNVWYVGRNKTLSLLVFCTQVLHQHHDFV